MSPLLPDELHIWLTRLEPSVIDAHTQLLTQDELAHAQKFTRPDARQRYLQVRTVVRRLLAAYANEAPQDLVFVRTGSGKPILVTATAPVNFNISHSGNYLALAVSTGQAVGIDCERMHERRNWRAIAERYFHPDELQRLLAQAEPAREFYYLWTLKEAFFKARGSGIATGLDKAVFHRENNVIHSRFAEELHADADSWCFRLWQWIPDFYLALACENTTGNPLQIDFFDGNAEGRQTGALSPRLLASSTPVASA